MSWVLDASMSLAWLFRRLDPVEASLADRALAELPCAGADVPAIWYAEMANGLLRGERMGVVSEQHVRFFQSQLSEMHIEMDREQPQARSNAVMDFARKYGLTAYDATYLELALRTGRTLATFDAKLAGAMRQAGGQVFGD